MIGFAHRGGMADAPENSREAFTSALAKGVDGIESDVWMLDGVPVLHHDAPRRGDSTVPLVDLLAMCGPGVHVSLDMKGPETAAATIAAAKETGFATDHLWMCGGGGRSRDWRSLDPDVRLVTDLRWRDAVVRTPGVLDQFVEWGINAVNLRHGRWTRRLIADVHAAGLLAFGWDVQHSWTLRHAERRGLDAVYSDHPDLLVRAR